MKSYICGFWRVLIIEGDDCNLVIIDTYSKSKGTKGEVIIQSSEVTVFQNQKMIGISVDDNEETIYEIECVDKVDINKVLDYVKRKYNIEEGCNEE